MRSPHKRVPYNWVASQPSKGRHAFFVFALLLMGACQDGSVNVGTPSNLPGTESTPTPYPHNETPSNSTPTLTPTPTVLPPTPTPTPTPTKSPATPTSTSTSTPTSTPTDRPPTPTEPPATPTPKVDADGDGFFIEDGDCNDTLSTTHPGASELCDGIDNDCDESIDEDTGWLLYPDTDGDAHGDPNGEFLSCGAVDGAVTIGDDCDDNSSLTFPAAPEICDGLDNDCDFLVDEGISNTYFTDGDGDGFGSDPSIESCEAPEGYVAQGLDCDDAQETTFPNANELCDGQDNDCDDAIDEGVQSTYFEDKDGDGFGDANTSVLACPGDDNAVANSLDCNDDNALIHLGASEICDGLDNNCNSSIDEPGDPAQNTYYQDADGDTHGDDNETAYACTLPIGYSEFGGDCAVENATTYPGAPELCLGGDNNCDGDLAPAISPTASSNAPVCLGEGLALFAEDINNATFLWTGPDDFSSSTQNPTLADVSLDSAGNYEVRSLRDGCPSEPTILSVSITAPDATINTRFDAPAVGQAVQFTSPSQDGATYDWTFEGATPSSSTENNPVVSWAALGSYTIELTVSLGGCDAFSSRDITVPAASCLQIKENNPDSEDGVYFVDVDGAGPEEPFDAYCDMTTDGGGWTLFLNRLTMSDNSGQPDINSAHGSFNDLRETNWNFDVDLFYADAQEFAFAVQENTHCPGCNIQDYHSAIKVPRGEATAFSLDCTSTFVETSYTKLSGPMGDHENTPAHWCPNALGWGGGFNECGGKVCHYGINYNTQNHDNSWGTNTFSEMHFPSSHSGWASNLYGGGCCRSCSGGLKGSDFSPISGTCCCAGGSTGHPDNSTWTIWAR